MYFSIRFFCVCLLKPLLACSHWYCPRKCPWMPAVFFSTLMFVYSLCVCLFVCSAVLQKGPGGLFHRLLVSNRAQHTLCLPGKDTYSGETACSNVHLHDTKREVTHLSWLYTVLCIWSLLFKAYETVLSKHDLQINLHFKDLLHSEQI